MLFLFDLMAKFLSVTAIVGNLQLKIWRRNKQRSLLKLCSSSVSVSLMNVIIWMDTKQLSTGNFCHYEHGSVHSVTAQNVFIMRWRESWRSSCFSSCNKMRRSQSSSLCPVSFSPSATMRFPLSCLLSEKNTVWDHIIMIYCLCCFWVERKLLFVPVSWQSFLWPQPVDDSDAHAAALNKLTPSNIHFQRRNFRGSRTTTFQTCDEPIDHDALL